MESGTTGIGRLDCYEDMFKEITRKLYGDDPDHRTSSVQNEFETSVSYKNDEDTENGNDSDDGNWTCEEEPLKGTDGSRIAAYHAGKTTWKCYECGDCMNGGPREIAEHFMDLHASRIILDDSRNRHHLPRKDYLQGDLKLEDILNYLERVRDRAESSAPPSRRTQETQTIPAALLPAQTTFLLQELPTTPPQQQQQQHQQQQQQQQQHNLHTNSPTMTPLTTTTPPTTTATSTSSTSSTSTSSSKRYTCPYCPYGTDRRDLYTRHENIHREEKPFHCYVCYKPFNRADHVKKHFLRMHREHTYELSRIRRNPGTNNNNNTIKTNQQQQQDTNTGINNNNNGTVQQQQNNYTTNYNNNNNNINNNNNNNNNKNYQLQTTQPGITSATTASSNMYQTSVIGNIQDNNGVNRRMTNTGCKSQSKNGSKGTQEKRYTCCYCSWSGVDNWCLKRHLNTHLKPFACALCEYKAARAERLATHVLKVHNKRQCSRCSFLGEDVSQLQMHQLHVHRINNSNTINSITASSSSSSSSPTSSSTTPSSQVSTINRHEPVHPVGVGRPPPGPPVFPAPSAPVISPPPPTTTTILSDSSSNRRSRSRKQNEPRKVLNQRRSANENIIDDNKDEIKKKIKLEIKSEKKYDYHNEDKNIDEKKYINFYSLPESDNNLSIDYSYEERATQALKMLLCQPIENNNNNIYSNCIKTEPCINSASASLFSLACNSGR